MDTLGWLVVIALLLGIAWAVRRSTERREDYISTEQRCKAERDRQANRLPDLKVLRERAKR